MQEILGEYVDRLVTVELRNRAMPHGITRQLYEAALAEGGGLLEDLDAHAGITPWVQDGYEIITF